MKALSLGCVLLPLLLVACGEVAETDAEGSDDPELRAAGITAIEVGRSTGFTPPPPPGSCRPAGTYSVDFASQQLRGNGCIAGKPISVDRLLSPEEFSRVRAGIVQVKTGRRPTSCPTDAPVTGLTVRRAAGTTHFVDERSACGGGSRPALSSTLATLYGVVESLATADAGKTAGFDFQGFRVASLRGAQICPELVDAVQEACAEAAGKATAVAGCATLCSRPVAERGKAAGFDFDGFRVANRAGGGEVCPEVVDPVAETCRRVGGKTAGVKGCDTLCSVPVAPEGKVAGFAFAGPKVMSAPKPGTACIEIVRPEEEACMREGGRVISAAGCQSLCSVPIVER